LGSLPLTEKALVMAILNVTPDSFSDGGVHNTIDAAVKSAWHMMHKGADCIDIGGESTRPGHVPLSADEEIKRIKPVFESLQAQNFPLPLSIDTSKAPVAKAALEVGASIVNDVWGFQRDPSIAAVTADYGSGAVLMHNRLNIDASVDIVSDVLKFFDHSLHLAHQAGMKDEQICLDPGIGFGKTVEQNYQVLAALPRLIALGFPILVGASRKSLIAKLFDPPIPVLERLPGTLALHSFAAMSGASILRVHDVAEHVQALRVCAKLSSFPITVN
jgi:dihydropteroate synthase